LEAPGFSSFTAQILVGFWPAQEFKSRAASDFPLDYDGIREGFCVGRNASNSRVGSSVAKTEIRFLKGFDPACVVPPLVKSARLRERFAVIQETYRADKVDMHFDDALWLCLLEFAVRFAPGARVKIVGEGDGKETAIEEFLSGWKTSEDREPPACILVREHESLALCVATEYWKQVGGPWPYHDSYTYSAFSNEDLSERLIEFLRDAEAAAGWDISPDVLQPAKRPTLRSRVAALFGRDGR
jgi:hypothetical protein